MLANQQRAFTFELGRFYLTFRSDITRTDRNPELILNLGVFFSQISSGTYVPYDPDYAGTHDAAHGVTTNEWPAEDWTRFKRTIIQNSQRFWNGKFWLLPPASTYQLCEFRGDAPSDRNRSDNQRHASRAQALEPGDPQQNLFSFNVYCKTNIYEAADAAHAHITINAPYLPTGMHDDGNFINSADAAGTHTGRFESGIVETRTFSGVAAIPHVLHHRHNQRQYLHEIGHALGQRHIGHDTDDAMCTEAPHAGPAATHNHCYVGNSETDERNVMGSGERLATVNAMPWKAAMASLTATAATDWEASMRRVYPRYLGTSHVRTL